MIVMKKFILTLFLSGLFFIGKAQEVGIRFGDVVGGNVAVDAIFTMGQYSRIHADASFGRGLGIEVLYDFLYRPLGTADGFDWYVGAGPYLFIGDPFQLGAVGEIGLEYHFSEIPLALGVDWRPTFRLVENTDFFADKFGFNIRYVISSQ